MELRRASNIDRQRARNRINEAFADIAAKSDGELDGSLFDSNDSHGEDCFPPLEGVQSNNEAAPARPPSDTSSARSSNTDPNMPEDSQPETFAFGDETLTTDPDMPNLQSGTDVHCKFQLSVIL